MLIFRQQLNKNPQITMLYFCIFTSSLKGKRGVIKKYRIFLCSYLMSQLQEKWEAGEGVNNGDSHMGLLPTNTAALRVAFAPVLCMHLLLPLVWRSG